MALGNERGRAGAAPPESRGGEGSAPAYEEIFRLLAETSSDAIIAMDARSNIVFANPAVERIFGYRPSELIGRPLTELIPPGMRDLHRGGVERYLRTGRRNIPWNGIELPGLHRSGREIPLEISFGEYFQDDEHYFTGFIRDVSDRRLAERRLAAEHAITRVLASAGSLPEAAPGILEAIGGNLGWAVGGFWSVTGSPPVLRVTDTWQAAPPVGDEFCRLSREFRFTPGVGFPGKVFEARTPVWIQDVVKDSSFPRNLSAAREGLHSAFSFPILVGGSCLGVVEFFSREIAEPDEALLQMAAAVGAEIGQFVRRRQVEDALRLSEETQRFLAEASSLLAATLDYRTTLISLSRLCVPRLGDLCMVDVVEDDGEVRRLAVAHADPRKEGEADALRLFPPDPRRSAGVAQVLRTGQSLLHPEVTVDILMDATRSPEHYHLLERLGFRSVMVVPLVARGRVQGAMTLVITESDRSFDREDLGFAEELARRAALAVDNARLYQAALVANQAKADFLAVMSHELRTPLNAILGYTDLMLMGVPEKLTDGVQRPVARVQTAARHLLQLIEEILTFSRMEAGRERVQIAEVNIPELVQEATAVAEPLAREKGLAFEVELPAGELKLVTDGRKVRQILINLLSNAVKFTDRGEVRLRISADDRDAVFEVLDTGVGISAEHKERVFDPFWQVEEASTRKAGGTGLGLSVARRLARMLGGEVTVESAPERGSRFIVRLPLEPPENEE